MGLYVIRRAALERALRKSLVGEGEYVQLSSDDLELAKGEPKFKVEHGPGYADSLLLMVLVAGESPRTAEHSWRTCESPSCKLARIYLKEKGLV